MKKDLMKDKFISLTDYHWGCFDHSKKLIIQNVKFIKCQLQIQLSNSNNNLGTRHTLKTHSLC